ncbi:hypothetical protein [Algoriphagus sp.]|uniref:hypothetical protein n=1 Tax=Algoriphagus sp. TaxID=1872435 RepID=UPI003F6F05B1
MTEDDLKNNLVLNENAYFFKKVKTGRLSKTLIEETFREASSEKIGRYLLKQVKINHKIRDKNEVDCSICVFKYQKKPSFIQDEIAEWNEVKLAYIVILDFDLYTVISKRNISGTKKIYHQIIPIDYKVMSSLFIDDNTSFEKFSMNNMNISDNVIRQKSMEAVDLKENISTFGLQSYILNNLRLNNNDDKISLSLNSSRINKFGKKNNIDFFIVWANVIVMKIETFNYSETFLSSFATPLDFEGEKKSLKPIAILFLLTRINDDYESNKVDSTVLRIGDKERHIDLVTVLNNFSRLLEIEQRVDDDGDLSYKVSTSIVDDLIVSMNTKSITLRSQKLKKVILKFSDDSEISIIDYYNRYSSYIINFDRVELVYSHRKLFMDNRLLGNIDSFLRVFQPNSALRNVKSEKGDFSTTSTAFSDDSLFGFVESEYLNDSDFFICDDLGREWADHIGLYKNHISFFHSKFNDSNFSASDFQEIVGQAQKNLGNLSPSDYQFASKSTLWSSNFNINSISTQIGRVRKGSSADDSIEYFKKLKTFPNLSKKVYLIINFISKSELEDRLKKLKKGESFRERNEVIQILWFVSSLISSCVEVNAEVYIICKP